MKNKLLKYFEQKKISCYIKENINEHFSTYTIMLENINDFKKFNNTMINELRYTLSQNVSINVSDKIEIVINNNIVNKKLENELCVPLGIKTDNSLLYVDFKNNPHWLVGGSTGSGKSVFLNNVITSLIENYKNSIAFAFVDLKKIEFHRYNGLNISLCNVCNTVEATKRMLHGVIDIMNERYDKYKSNNVLDIYSYNGISEIYNGDRFIFVIIDELAELILQGDNELLELLQRLLQLGRAAGIFVICATQRPSSDILPGILKVNFTTRICFKVSSSYDSKTVINTKGAEFLNGNGDGLALVNGSFKLDRFQGFPPYDNTKILEDLKEC